MNGPDPARILLTELGVREIIHAGGTKSTMGGTLMSDDVIGVMAAAASIFVPVAELARAAGEYTARTFGADAAAIVSGAASGCVLAAKAARDVHETQRTSAQRPEVITQRRHFGRYTYLYEQAGCHVIEIGTMNDCTLEDYASAITGDTSSIAWLEGPGIRSAGVDLAAVCSLARNHGVPVIVDAAAMAFPRSTIRAYLDAGADLVVVSGGKMIAGPQASGIALGRCDLVDRVAAQTAPHQGLGRPHKISKEVILGLVAAVRRFGERDEEAQLVGYRTQVEELRLRARAANLFGSVRHDGVHHVPSLVFGNASESFGRPPSQVSTALLARSVRIYVPFDDATDELWVNPISLRPGEGEVVLDALIEEAGRS